MQYEVKAHAIAKNDAILDIKKSKIDFGTTMATADVLPNPAELLLGALAACILKNVERFSGLLRFEYSRATVEITALRKESPPTMDDVNFHLTLYSKDKKLPVELLKRNLEKFGTIYNTLQIACKISGDINVVNDYV